MEGSPNPQVRILQSTYALAGVQRESGEKFARWQTPSALALEGKQAQGSVAARHDHARLVGTDNFTGCGGACARFGLPDFNDVPL